MEIHKSVSTVISYLPVVGLLLLAATWPFAFGNVQRVIFYATGIGYIVDYIYNCRWRGWKWDRRKIVYVFFILFFCLVPIWGAIDTLHTPLLSKTLESYGPFLVIGVCGILGMTDKFRMEYMAIVMLVVGALIVGYVTYMVGGHCSDFSSWILNFNHIRATCINSHMVVNLYWNMTIILAIFALTHRKDFPTALRVVIVVLMLPILFALLITEGRTGLLTFLLISFLFMVYYYMSHRNYKWILLLIGLFMGSALMILKNNDRITEARRYRNPRVYIWKVAVETIKDKPVLGYGVCSARKEFVQRGLNDMEFCQHYADSYRATEAVVRHHASIDLMHPHNVILETWLQFGIIGVLIWLACCICPLCMHLGEFQLNVDLCMLAFFMQSCFESLGTHLQPLYLCLPVLLFHYQYLADDIRTETKRQFSH